MKRLPAFLLFLVAAAAASAAPLARDLGRNLAFLRVHSLPADFPSPTAARNQPCVLDLRYARVDDASAAALWNWIRSRATARTPVFILANAATDRNLLAATSPAAISHVLVIGTTAGGFTPDIAVPSSPEAERRAYDALENGADVATLLVENGDKARNDEASLSRDRSTEPAEPAAGADDARPRTTPPPVDAALQRAVHLHRALVALKKI